MVPAERQRLRFDDLDRVLTWLFAVATCVLALTVAYRGPADSEDAAPVERSHEVAAAR